MTGGSHILSQINRLRGPKEGHEFPQMFVLLRILRCSLRLFYYLQRDGHNSQVLELYYRHILKNASEH